MDELNISVTPRDYKIPEFHEVKVIGVGGAGKNAINNLKKINIQDIDLIALNTDAADLEVTMCEHKILLGPSETGGNGAGNNPEVGRRAAMEVLTEIETMLDAPTISRVKNKTSTTQMVFIVAGMGGGTGTGAAPVVAKLCRDRNFLTIGVVVTPQKNEGSKRQNQAKLGMEEMHKYVDALMVVDNQKMVDIFPDYPYDEVLKEGDMILATAVKAVSDIITKTYGVNIDYHDIQSTLINSQYMTVGMARRGGENRAVEVVDAALDSPLLKDNCIIGAKRAILVINYNYDAPRENKPTTKEIDNILARLNEKVGLNIDKIQGFGNDETLENDIELVLMVADFKGSQEFEDSYEEKIQEFNDALKNNNHYLAWELISELKKINNHLGNDLSGLIEKLNTSSLEIFETKCNYLENAIKIQDLTELSIKEAEENLIFIKERLLPIVSKILDTANSKVENLTLIIENKKDELRYLPKYNKLKREILEIVNNDNDKIFAADIQNAKSYLKQIEYDVNKLINYVPDINSVVNELNNLINKKEDEMSKLIITLDASGNFDKKAISLLDQTRLNNDANPAEIFGSIEIKDIE